MGLLEVTKARYRIGSTILAYWNGDKSWYSATVLKVIDYDCLYIEYSDGLEKKIKSLSANTRLYPTQAEILECNQRADRKWDYDYEGPMYPQQKDGNNEVEDSQNQSELHITDSENDYVGI